MVHMSTEVLETYRDFLGELLKTENKPSKLQEQLKGMLASLSEDEIPRDSERVHSFLDFLNGVFEKRSVQNWGAVCKEIQKKSTKAHKVFFLHSPSEARDVNVGTIALQQPMYNSMQIQNYLFIIYCNVCHLVYGDADNIPEGKTRTHYWSILELLENSSSPSAAAGAEEEGGAAAAAATTSPLFPGLEGLATDSLLNTYKEALDDVCEKGMDGKQLSEIVFSSDNPVVGMIGGALKSVLNDAVDLESVKQEVEKLDKEDITSILKDVREKIDTIDLASLMSSIQTMDPSKMGETVKTLQESIFSSTKDRM